MEEVFDDLHFPKAGVHRAGAFGRQPVRQGKDGVYVKTCLSAANVRGFDPATGRDRGGSRPGLLKFIAARVAPEEWIVQHLASFVSTQAGSLSVQLSQSGRVVYLLAVSQGQVRVATPESVAWTDVVNNSGEDPPLNFTGVMQSAANNQKMYFVDGINFRYYNAVTNSIENWTATAGSLPVDDEGNAPRLVCTWRGRTVCSGLLKDPQNWFMSKVSDPHDFDYAPNEPSAVDAIAGNNSPFGLIGDSITGLCPLTDDVLVVFGDHTVYAIRGDPANNGSIDVISDITGAAFGEAFCKDPDGNVYFFGNKPSVWMMQGAGVPQRVSAPIDPLLADVDTGRNIVKLIWNEREQGVHVFVTKDDQPTATRHYFYDKRMNAWWPDVYANLDHNPVAIAALDGNRANDRVVLLGGWDGYVRKITHDAATDDGTVIASEVWLGPILTQEMDEMLLKDVQAVLGETSGTINWAVHDGDTAEAAVAAAASVTGTFAAGRNPTQPVRRANHAIYIKLSGVTRWAFEALRARFAGRGKVRRRKP